MAHPHDREPTPEEPPAAAGLADARADARRTVGRSRQNVRPGQRLKNALRTPVFVLMRPFAEDTRRADKALLRYVLALEQRVDELAACVAELEEAVERLSDPAAAHPSTESGPPLASGDAPAAPG